MTLSLLLLRGSVTGGSKDRRVGLTAEGKRWASLSADNATQIRAFVPSTEELRARGRGPCHVGE